MDNKFYLLPVSLSCNANCFFCSTKSYNISKNTNMQIDDKFNKNISLLRAKGYRNIEITGGGEPLLNNNINNIISKILSSFEEPYIKLYTNGSLLKDIPKINEVNISCVHWDDETNIKIMNHKSSFNIRESIKFYRDLGIDNIRLSVPLIKGVIDSSEKLDKFVNNFSNLVDNFVARPLYPITPNIDNHYVDFDYFNKIVEIDRDACGCHDATSPVIWASNNNLFNDWELKNLVSV